MRKFDLALIAGVMLTLLPAYGAETPYTFQEALDRGAIAIQASHPQGETDNLIKHLPDVDPGIISGFSYFWGGPTQKRLENAAADAANIRQQLPRVLLEGLFTEGVHPGYDETLHCGGTMGDRRFSVDQISAGKAQTKTNVWVDLAKPGAVAFYECVGSAYINMGTSLIRFEAPGLMTKNSINPAAELKGFKQVQNYLHIYAASKGLSVIWGGDPVLAQHMHMDYVTVPSRFYHTFLQSALKYQNIISRPGIGVGYSYALSPLMVSDTVNSVPPGTKVFFNIDNWDSRQDDLRRYMELDADNRRFLVQQSVINAHRKGAYFMPDMDGCGGCTPVEVVVDPCELVLSQKTGTGTEYNAIRCNDLPSLKTALHYFEP
jgi:hypothetical protein